MGGLPSLLWRTQVSCASLASPAIHPDYYTNLMSGSPLVVSSPSRQRLWSPLSTTSVLAACSSLNSLSARRFSLVASVNSSRACGTLFAVIRSALTVRLASPTAVSSLIQTASHSIRCIRVLLDVLCCDSIPRLRCRGGIQGPPRDVCQRRRDLHGGLVHRHCSFLVRVSHCLAVCWVLLTMGGDGIGSQRYASALRLWSPLASWR